MIKLDDMKRILLVVLALTISFFDASAQKRKKSDDKVFDKAVIELIEKRDFKLVATQAHSQGGRSVSLNRDYSVELRGDSIISHLPFYGRAYRIPYGGGDGLSFESTIKEYKIKEGKKGSIEVRFSSRTREDTFDFTITIYPNGSANIVVTSNNRQSMSYHAELELKSMNKQ